MTDIETKIEVENFAEELFDEALDREGACVQLPPRASSCLGPLCSACAVRVADR